LLRPPPSRHPDRRVCHRDIKTENILWESKGPQAEIKLIDFGMSARMRGAGVMRDKVGTVYCMAPEVLLVGEYVTTAAILQLATSHYHLLLLLLRRAALCCG